MLIYLAGSSSGEALEKWANRSLSYAPVVLGKDDDPLDFWHSTPNFLFTFADSSARQCAEHFCVKPCYYDFCSQPHRHIFIDSGAYSVWKRGAEVDLNEYIKFCKKIKERAKCSVVFAALDVIPGKKGEKPSPAEREKACEIGWENYQEMKRQGVPCLPTYHQFEKVKWLKRIEGDCDYFAVSPNKGLSANERHRWLESVFRSIDRSKKIHGLGVSSYKWLQQFPFFSVDRRDWLFSFKNNCYPMRSLGSRNWSVNEFQRKFGITMDRKALAKLLGFSLPGDKPDPEGEYGSYWLETLAIARELHRQREISKFWRQKGVGWDDDVECGAKNARRRACCS